jgi:metal-sulfur cluster biosynthetic enzyme
MNDETAFDDGGPYRYEGPPGLKAPIETALRRVIDPELALTIIDVGLVHGVVVAKDEVLVTVTMTSAACPVTDVILADVETELDDVLPAGMRIAVQLVWEPPWTAERLSARAKVFMGW